MYTLKSIEGAEFEVSNIDGIADEFPENLFSVEENLIINAPFSTEYTQLVSDYMNTNDFRPISALSFKKQLQFLKVAYYFNLPTEFMKKMAEVLSANIYITYLPEEYYEDIYEISKYFPYELRFSLMYNCGVYLKDIKGIVLNFDLKTTSFYDIVWKNNGFIRYNIYAKANVDHLFTIHHKNEYKFKRVIISGYRQNEQNFSTSLLSLEPLKDISLENCGEEVHKLLFGMIHKNRNTLKRVNLCCSAFDLHDCDKLKVVSIDLWCFNLIQHQDFAIETTPLTKKYSFETLSIPSTCNTIEITNYKASWYRKLKDRRVVNVSVHRNILNLNIRKYPISCEGHNYEISFYGQFKAPALFTLNNTMFSSNVLNLKYLHITSVIYRDHQNLNFDQFLKHIDTIAPNVEILGIGFNAKSRKDNLLKLTKLQNLKFLQLFSTVTVDDETLYQVIYQAEKLMFVYVYANNIPEKCVKLSEKHCRVKSNSLISCCFQQHIDGYTRIVQFVGAESQNAQWMECISDWRRLLRINYRFVQKYFNSFNSKTLRITILNKPEPLLFNEMNLFLKIENLFEIENKNYEVILQYDKKKRICT